MKQLTAQQARELAIMRRPIVAQEKIEEQATSIFNQIDNVAREGYQFVTIQSDIPLHPDNKARFLAYGYVVDVNYFSHIEKYSINIQW